MDLSKPTFVPITSQNYLEMLFEVVLELETSSVMQNIQPLGEKLIPVSYTHLDVYKRQITIGSVTDNYMHENILI